jgi:hypothetical protein
MSLSYRQEDQLRRAEAGVCWSDPHLAGMLGVLGRLYADDGMSPGSRWPRSPPAGATSGKPPPEAWPQRPAQQGCRRDHRQTGALAQPPPGHLPVSPPCRAAGELATAR